MSPASSTSTRSRSRRAEVADRRDAALASGRAPRALWLLASAATLVVGCNWIGAAAYYLGPRRMQKPEHTLTTQRLAIVVDRAPAVEENPIFERTLHETLEKIFEERKVKTQVIPQRELDDLRRDHPEYESWSLQRVGRELNAEEVLNLYVDELRFREVPDHPVIEPRVRMRAKVIGVSQPPDKARLWPASGAEVRPVVCSRDTKAADSQRVLDEESAKLAKDTAQIVATFFYQVDLDEKTPREP